MSTVCKLDYSSAWAAFFTFFFFLNEELSMREIEVCKKYINIPPPKGLFF